MTRGRLVFISTVLGAAIFILGSTMLPASAKAAGSEAAIPPGTVITEANWQQYKGYMTPSMQAMWAGTYDWKFGPNYRMVVGETMHYDSPPQFKKYTEQYSGQVQIETLPDGRHVLKNYVAGLPFPIPQEQMKGGKSARPARWRRPPASRRCRRRTAMAARCCTGAGS